MCWLAHPLKGFGRCCSCYTGYVGGLATTIVVMNVFGAAQPALLYIVPAVLGTSLGHAAINKEFNQVGLACKAVPASALHLG